MKEFIEHIMWSIKKFFRRIKNVISWVPTLWRAQWYEYDTFYHIMRFNLNKMIHQFKTFHVQYVGIERDIELMETCVRLIDKLIEEQYCDESFNEIHRKYGNSKMITEPYIPKPGEPENRNGWYTYKGIQYERIIVDTETDEKDRRAIIKAGEKKQEKARKLLFYILYEKLEHWWI